MNSEVLTPCGKDEIIRTFGNIYDYINADGTLQSEKWESLILKFCFLPFPMHLSWNKTRVVSQFRCHYLLSHTFELCFNEIYQNHLEKECLYFGGCYSFRAQRGSKKISTHAWGIAIDINPDTNPLGSEGNIHRGIVKIFEDHGFIWGGNFQRLDFQHFQFAKNY